MKKSRPGVASGEHPDVSASDKLTGYLEMWKQAVTVQQHFNEICWKIRGLALTSLTVVLGVASLVAGSNAQPLQEVVLWGFQLRSAAAVLLVGVFVWLAFFFVDASWYHRLLKAAVDQGAAVERELKHYLPAAGLTAAISDKSPSKVWPWKKLHSTGKLRLFYLTVAVLLVALAAILQFGGLSASPAAEVPPAVRSAT